MATTTTPQSTKTQLGPERQAANGSSQARALRARLHDLAPGELFIDGSWRPAEEGRATYSTDPSTGEPITAVAVASQADADSAVAAARRAFDEGLWPRMNPTERGEVIARIGQLLADRAEEFALRETADVGKPITPTRTFDVPQAAALFSYYGALAGELDGAARPGIRQSMAYTRREPLGVVGAITPFNFPLNLAVNKLAPALAAGNTIVHKPALETSLSALLLPELFRQAGLPDGVYNLVTGDGETVADGSWPARVWTRSRSPARPVSESAPRPRPRGR